MSTLHVVSTNQRSPATQRRGHRRRPPRTSTPRTPLVLCAALAAVAPTVMLTSGDAHGDVSDGAASPVRTGAAEIQLALDKLGVVGSVLYIAAHPDDENTNLLAYLANGALLRTGYLSITRGDGGQNLIGAEQGPELGLIRTQELLAARRIDGAEQFFTRARDFGFSKSPEETLRIWGEDQVLSDVVWVIRRFRPDVIITRFSPDPSDTHGHHTASARLAVAAFRAAADPHAYPDQLSGGVVAWQARRLLWNRSSWGVKPGEDLSRFATLDVGGYNALLGQSYGEMAADSRSMHKSQGFGVARSRGPQVEYFKVLADASASGPAVAPPLTPSVPRAAGLFNGLDFSWTGRWPAALAVRDAVSTAQQHFNSHDPAASLPALWAIDAALEKVPDATWRAQKQRETHQLIAACSGLFVDATAADHRVAPGGSVEVTATALNRSRVPLTLREVRFLADGAKPLVVSVGRQLVTAPPAVAPPFEISQVVTIPLSAEPSTPYWLAAPPLPGLYTVADPRAIGQPEQPSPLRVEFVFDGGRGRPLLLSRPIRFKWTDPVAGERYRPLEVTPAVSVRPDTNLLLFPSRDRRPHALVVRLQAGAPATKGTLRAVPPAGWAVTPAAIPFRLERKDQSVEVTFQVRRTVPSPGDNSASAQLDFVTDLDGAAASDRARLARGVVQIEHPHIPIQTWLADGRVRLVALELRTAGTKLAYVPGPGDQVPDSLRRVGYQVTVLTDESLRGAAANAALSGYDAIVVGVRAFNTNERLRAAHDILMKYVEGGGTLVVQYNTNSRIGPLSMAVGPFPLEIGRDRVTDETAPVTFVAPEHPLLNRPNRIGARDFEGWVQERGLYFAEKWDPRYQPVLSMHDAGEKPLTGSLLVARHGRGTFIYTGLSFFRQLPAGVPGAFRLFANLVAGGANPNRGTRGP